MIARHSEILLLHVHLMLVLLREDGQQTDGVLAHRIVVRESRASMVLNWQMVHGGSSSKLELAALSKLVPFTVGL